MWIYEKKWQKYGRDGQINSHCVEANADSNKEEWNNKIKTSWNIWVGSNCNDQTKTFSPAQEDQLLQHKPAPVVQWSARQWGLQAGPSEATSGCT